jgi:hypothetical protein
MAHVPDTNPGQERSEAMNDERTGLPADRLESVEDLLHRSVYSPEEAATLLDMDVRQIHAAAYRGELKAHIVGKDIVSINRAELIRWLRERA